MIPILKKHARNPLGWIGRGFILSILFGMCGLSCIVDEFHDRGFLAPYDVVITYPSQNDTLPTSFQIYGTAKDDLAVSYVQISIDGENWLDATGTEEWSYSIEELTTGSHEIQVRVGDAYSDNEDTYATLDISCQRSGQATMLADLANIQDAPAIAGDDNTLGIVWHDFRNSSDYNLYFRDINLYTGKSTAEFSISQVPGDQKNPAIAYYDGVLGLVYEQHNSAPQEIDLEFNTLTKQTDDTVSVGSIQAISETNTNQQNPDLAANANGWGVAWEDSRNGNKDIYFKFIDGTTLEVGNEVPIIVAANDQYDPQLCAYGNNFVVTWVDERDGNAEIYLRSVNPLNANVGEEIKITDNPGFNQMNPSIIYFGTEFGLVFETNKDGNQDIYMTRFTITSGMTPPDSTGLYTLSSDQINPHIFATSTGYGVTWEDNRNGNWDVYVYHETTIGDAYAVKLSSGDKDDLHQEAVFNGHVIGTVWTTGTSPNLDIMYNWQVP
jgi:hypothetical protein